MSKVSMEEATQLSYVYHVTSFLIFSIVLSVLRTLSPNSQIKGVKAIGLNIISVFAVLVSLSHIWLFFVSAGDLTRTQIYVFVASIYNALFYTATLMTAVISSISAFRKKRIRILRIQKRRAHCTLLPSGLLKLRKEKHRLALLEEIKMVFDGIKQIALAVTIAYGLKVIQEPMIDAGFSPQVIVLVNWLYAINIILLFGWSYLWICLSFKTKPYSRSMHLCGLAFLTSFSLIILGYFFKVAYKEVPFGIW